MNWFSMPHFLLGAGIGGAFLFPLQTIALVIVFSVFMLYKELEDNDEIF